MLMPGKGFSMAAPGPYMGPNCHASAMARPGYATARASPALDMAMLWRFAVFARDIILSALAMHWLWHGKVDKWNIGRSGLCCAGHSNPAMIKHGLAVTVMDMPVP